jgi:hypothetical protein
MCVEAAATHRRLLRRAEPQPPPPVTFTPARRRRKRYPAAGWTPLYSARRFPWRLRRLSIRDRSLRVPFRLSASPHEQSAPRLRAQPYPVAAVALLPRMIPAYSYSCPRKAQMTCRRFILETKPAPTAVEADLGGRTLPHWVRRALVVVEVLPAPAASEQANELSQSGTGSRITRRVVHWVTSLHPSEA